MTTNAYASVESLVLIIGAPARLVSNLLLVAPNFRYHRTLMGSRWFSPNPINY